MSGGLESDLKRRAWNERKDLFFIRLKEGGPEGFGEEMKPICADVMIG